ncbi:MAG TPA: glutamate--tRNA ligase family protein [Victivallales bacterium]|nr:glutamate--tRNA ligase family protein [Victivallales bacterium]HPO89983.1 glutamate--tRNA ligase family protein [Victivallales bacterium]HRR29026.1 glutamate--tRNA ligase family protein [Victivallales bacterium]
MINKLKVRFAPSPTGHVHIGNIRVAIFNWLYARSQNGLFLLRIEDTDVERSTESAVNALFNVLEWLGLNYDGEVLYQSTQFQKHLETAEKLIKTGFAIKKNSENSKGQPIIFIFPYDCSKLNFVREKEKVTIQINHEEDISLSLTGAKFSYIENEKIIEKETTLAGLYKLQIFDKENKIVFNLDEKIKEISEQEIKISNASKIEFIRREVFFKDEVKGELSKPLDSMKDFVIVRSNNTPVFHLANVCDDITQEINFIMRGDDHVENTFRHLFLFSAIGYQPPRYAHLPMIVNQQGKPYSKRDGDAYVGDFRDKGFLPQALFNYLALLGWSPGDDREKMTKEEMIREFSVDRIKSSPAQFDIQKLINMNGLYISELNLDEFINLSYNFIPWSEKKPEKEKFAKIAKLMHPRTKTFAQVSEWKYFFFNSYEINSKDRERFFSGTNKEALLSFAETLNSLKNLNAYIVESLIRKTEEKFNLKKGSLNLPLRIALSGVKSGPPIEDIILLLGASDSSIRIKKKICEN